MDPTNISPGLSPIDIQNLRDFEIDSTTESQTVSTMPTNAKGESCKSFEYHERTSGSEREKTANKNSNNGSNGFPKSPFEREIQRLLNESSSRAAARENIGGRHVEQIQNNNQMNASHNHKAKYELECLEKPKISLGHHPVGLEAIKEITRNKNPSESSQM